MRIVMAAVLLVLLGGCATATMMGAGQGGQAADGRSYEAARADNTISAAVDRALVHDREMRAMDIHVETYNGVVTLTGQVDDAAMARRAERLVRQVEGVRDVDNRLQIGR